MPRCPYFSVRTDVSFPSLMWGTRTVPSAALFRSYNTVLHRHERDRIEQRIAEVGGEVAKCFREQSEHLSDRRRYASVDHEDDWKQDRRLIALVKGIAAVKQSTWYPACIPINPKSMTKPSMSWICLKNRKSSSIFSHWSDWIRCRGRGRTEDRCGTSVRYERRYRRAYGTLRSATCQREFGQNLRRGTRSR